MKIQICNGKKCRERQSLYIQKRLENDTKFYAWENIEIESCLCLGNCEKAPNMLLDGKIQEKLNPIKASEILKSHFNSQK